MSIVILKWNPSFSSYTMGRFLNQLEKCALYNDDRGMNWSIWDADKVKKGDICFLLKVGYGQTGIVARGTITSDPYSGEDWSWRNRPTKYCDFDFDTMINPDAFPILNSSELTKAIPDFDWNGGHSGIVLTEEQETVFQQLWYEYMQTQAEYFEKASDDNLFLLQPAISTDTAPYTIELSHYDRRYLYIKATENGITTEISISNYPRFLGKFGVRSHRAARQLLISRYPSVADLNRLCADLFSAQIEFDVDFDQATD